MPSYPFRCPRCGFRVVLVRHSSARNDPVRCPECRHNLSRDFNYRIGTSFFPEGFNPGLGTHISSRRGLNERLKVVTEEAWANSGVDTTYALSDDPQAFGLDKDRLEWRRETDRKARKQARV